MNRPVDEMHEQDPQTRAPAPEAVPPGAPLPLPGPLPLNALIAIGYCVLVAANLQLRDASGITPMWAPIGLALFVLLRFGNRAC